MDLHSVDSMSGLLFVIRNEGTCLRLDLNAAYNDLITLN
jgi:hypothetical protein